jgi:hypothetical protein
LKSRIKELGGYNIYIKRKQLKYGKGDYQSRGYKKANQEPLDKESALGLGASEVDRYTNRQFYIKRVAAVGKRKEELARKISLLSKFRTAKHNSNSFVEKETFAIDSAEEREGIPYEAARQRRKLQSILSNKKSRILTLKVGKNIKRRQKKATWL